MIVPRKLQNRVIKLFHASEAAAHPGAEETLRKIKSTYHWRDMAYLVRRFVKNCVTCSRIKSRQQQTPAPLRPNVPKTPWETISVDTLGPYPEAREGEKYIVIVTDIFSKWVEAKATLDTDATTIVKYLRDEIFSRFGTPKTLITDQGSNFKSVFMKKYCEKNEIELRHVATAHQRANPVERRVQELKKVLRFLMSDRQTNTWPLYLPRALFTLRTRRNLATNETPSKILLGYELPQVGEWKVPTYVQNRLHDQRPNHDKIIERQHDYMQKYAPPEPTPLAFDVGQKVLIRKTQAPNNPFAPLWEGPFKILQKLSPEIYELKKRKGTVQHHIDDLRLAPRQQGDVDSSTTEEESSSEPDTDRETDAHTQATEEKHITSTGNQPTRRRRRCRLIIKKAEEETSSESDSEHLKGRSQWGGVARMSRLLNKNKEIYEIPETIIIYNSNVLPQAPPPSEGPYRAEPR